MYTAVRRDLCTRSVHNQSKVTFQSSGRKVLVKCLTIKLIRIPSTRSFGTHYLDDPQASRIEHGSSGLGPAPRRPAEQADGAERHWHLQHDLNRQELQVRQHAANATRSTCGNTQHGTRCGCDGSAQRRRRTSSQHRRASTSSDEPDGTGRRLHGSSRPTRSRAGSRTEPTLRATSRMEPAGG